MSHTYVQPGAYLYHPSQSPFYGGYPAVQVAPTPQPSQPYPYAPSSYTQYPTTYNAYPPSPSTASPASTVHASPFSAPSPGFPANISEYKSQPRAARRTSHAKRGTASRSADLDLGDFLDHDVSEKPGYTVKELCAAAIRGSKRGRLTLQEICETIQSRYPYYRKEQAATALRKSAKHDLSLDQRFVKYARPPLEPGRGAYWGLADGKETGKAKKAPSGESAAAFAPTRRRRSTLSAQRSAEQGTYVPGHFIASPQSQGPAFYPSPTGSSQFMPAQAVSYDFSGYTLR